MAKKKASRQKKMQTRVDFTPMVDMMMLLITFFMLCTSLAKPQTMNLTMPSNDENISDKDRNAAKASQTVTIYVCGNDKIYHVDGLPKYDDPTCLKETTWGQKGIRSVLFNHITEDGSQPVKDIMMAKDALDKKKLANPAAYPEAVYDAELTKIKKGELETGKVPTMTITIKGGYAIPAFNFNNLEQLQAIIKASSELKSPVILQVSKGARAYANETLLRYMAEGAVEYAKELGCEHPEIVLHLDHGDSFELCKSCIDLGFSSVMIDGSSLPYEENIALTKKVVDYAHQFDVTVEGELGVLAGVEDEVSSEVCHYTKPEEVIDFTTRTGVDSLAISSSRLTCSTLSTLI